MTTGSLTIEPSGDPARDRAIIWDRLVAFNREQAGPNEYRPFTLTLRAENGETVGGAYGALFFRWLHVEMLVVPEGYRGRGHGRALLERIEKLARAEGCIGVWLDTYAFQAPGFYARAGFHPIGTLEDIPPGSRKIFLAKRLA